jgi:hypothetical protein
VSIVGLDHVQVAAPPGREPAKPEAPATPDPEAAT